MTSKDKKGENPFGKSEQIPWTEGENQRWREGYDAGMKTALRENDEAINVGRAILNVLDGRYEFKKEDY